MRVQTYKYQVCKGEGVIGDPVQVRISFWQSHRYLGHMECHDEDDCHRADNVAKLQNLNAHPCLLLFSNLTDYIIVLIIKNESARSLAYSEAVEHAGLNPLAKDMVTHGKNQIYK